MADESTVFGLGTLGAIVGSGILLFGVQQTNGEEFNAIMLVGGLAILAAAGVLSLGVAGIESPEGH